MEKPSDIPLRYLKGVGPKRAELLRKELNIDTFGDLLQYYPFRYIDRSRIHRISEIDSDVAYVQLKGRIYGLQTIGEKRARRMTATLPPELDRAITVSADTAHLGRIRTFVEEVAVEVALDDTARAQGRQVDATGARVTLRARIRELSPAPIADED